MSSTPQTTQKVPMTKNGAEKLRQELQHLKSVERPAIIQAIKEARGHGDLKENAEYHAAREKQSFIEGRIQVLEYKLSQAQIIDVSVMKNDGKVIFGATVVITNLDDDSTQEYHIVGEDEADIKAFKLSITSPIARALIGKLEGDVVEVQTLKGVISYEITEVKYI